MAQVMRKGAITIDGDLFDELTAIAHEHKCSKNEALRIWAAGQGSGVPVSSGVSNPSPGASRVVERSIDVDSRILEHLKVVDSRIREHLDYVAGVARDIDRRILDHLGVVDSRLTEHLKLVESLIQEHSGSVDARVQEHLNLVASHVSKYLQSIDVQGSSNPSHVANGHVPGSESGKQKPQDKEISLYDMFFKGE